jgi:hypothetical protein
MLRNAYGHLLALYIAIDIWLFHKTNEITDFYLRRIVHD